MGEETVDQVERYVLRSEPLATTAAEISRELDLAKPDVLTALRTLEHMGRVESKETGAHSIAWWHTDRVKPVPPEHPAEHPDQAGFTEMIEERAPEYTRDRVDRDLELVDDVDDDLESALASWNPGRNVQERRERKRAGIEVLRWLRDDGEVSRRDVVDELYSELAIGDQSEDTFWRRVAKPALSNAADSGFVDASGRTYKWVGA